MVKDMQQWSNSCLASKLESKECFVHCNGATAVRGTDSECYTGPWSECSAQCMRTRSVGSRVSTSSSTCVNKIEAQRCEQFQCAQSNTASSATLDFRIVGVNPSQWSYVLTEDLADTLAKLLDLPEHAFRLPADSLRTIDGALIFHISVRSDRKEPLISDEVNRSSFKSDLCSFLYSKTLNTDWRWLQPSNLTVRSFVDNAPPQTQHAVVQHPAVHNTTVLREKVALGATIEAGGDSSYFAAFILGIFICLLFSYFVARRFCCNSRRAGVGVDSYRNGGKYRKVLVRK